MSPFCIQRSNDIIRVIPYGRQECSCSPTSADARHACAAITRPPIATQRLSIDRQGRVVYQYKQPFRDGSTHVMQARAPAADPQQVLSLI